MASVSTLKDIEDKFCECSYCLENFKEPKLLPCVHRYCQDCLAEIIGDRVGNFNCPLCNYLCDIPANGIEGFKTDFHMKSLLQYIQLKQSAKAEEITAECGGCSKEVKMVSYCFKCNGFLCDQCHQIHNTFKMMKEHKPSVLSLKDIKDQKLTLERLYSLTETPRCDVHIEKAAEVCCGSCDNLPICMVCGHHGEHKGHELHDVRLLARAEREKMGTALVTMEKYKDTVHQLPTKVEDAKGNLSENVSAKREKLQIQYIEERGKIRRQLEENEELLERNIRDIDDIEKQELIGLEKERRKEIEAAVKKINDKYDKLVEEKQTKNQNLRDGQECLYGEKRAKINRRLGFIDKEYKDINKSMDIHEEENSEEIEQISTAVDNRKERFDNFRSSVSSILASRNDWTDVQCLPDISRASGPLIEDVKREYPELDSLIDITVSDLPSVTADTVTITEQAESVTDIEGVKGNGWSVWNMATTDDGSIVITGDAGDNLTHITVINKQGEVLSQKKTKNTATFGSDKKFRLRSCSPLTLFKVATTCRDSEVGIYDIQNGTYFKKNMSDITSSWNISQCVTCVATDRINKNIFVGSSSKNVYILEDSLNYCRTLLLPEGIQRTDDLTICDGTLIVCDAVSKRAYVCAIEGPEAQLICELPRPDREGGDWAPFIVCTDTSNGFIYILWGDMISEDCGCIITQHSQDGRRLLITKPIDDNAIDITTVITEDREKLILTTENTGKLYTYGLVMS